MDSRKACMMILDGEFGIGLGVKSTYGEVKEYGALAIARPVLHWSWKVGERIRADCRVIGVDGMCLVPPCIGIKHSKWSLRDVLFRSGPPSSRFTECPWGFYNVTRPDAIVTNIGNSGALSLPIIQQSLAGINGTYAIKLFKEKFEDAFFFFNIIARISLEDAYVDLVRSIRQARIQFSSIHSLG
ncbi:hypothetical protein BDZ91DRAFT_440330 [Kalaharituber pfeilii]|nr:hypothetical protein BDZ91DRAFT_440330 [Kalaharituber pfeilii]